MNYNKIYFSPNKLRMADLISVDVEQKYTVEGDTQRIIKILQEETSAMELKLCCNSKIRPSPIMELKLCNFMTHKC